MTGTEAGAVAQPVDSPSPRATRALLAACFFVSGGAGLVYEVLWSRHLHVLFGSTTESVAAVLAVFMTGLGVGGHLLGRLADRSRSPMRLYGLLEIGVGLFALVTPALLGVARVTWTAIAPHVEAAGPSGLAVKLLLAAVVLVPPATLMGGTLPALVRATADSGDKARAQVGLLYALNTLGAVAGTLGTGFVLVEVLGLSASMRLTAVVNIGIGALVVARARRHGPAPMVAPEAGSARPFAALRTLAATGKGRYVLAGLFFSGAITMVCEVVFTRVLGLVFGVSSYAFTLVLAVFLAGLGLGALWAQRVAKTRAPSAADFGASQVGVAAVATLAMLAIPAVPRLLLYARQVPDLSFGAVLAVKAGLALFALLPLALVAGLGTPLLLAALAADEDVGRAGRVVGDGYMVNTAGTLLGSLAAGFVLIERLGTQGALRGAIVVAAALGLVGLLVQRERGGRAGRLAAGGAALAIAAVALGAGRWPPHTFLFSDSRAHQISQTGLQLEQRLHLSPSEVLFFAEGREATVGVLSSGERTLVVNGHPDASDRSDMSTQLLLSLVPLSVHPQPRDVLVVGFGSGVSADAAARTPGVEQVDVVELERAVLDASPAFHHVNHAVEKNPRVRVVRDDARSFLGATTRRYDVMVSEPSNPWRAGVASLFTVDFYRSAASALKPGGAFTQWVQLYALSEDTLRLIFATLLQVFPEVQVWWLDTGNIAVVASMTPLPLDRDRLREVLGARAKFSEEPTGALRDSGAFTEELRRHAHLLDPDELLGRFLLDSPGVRAFVTRNGAAGEAAQAPVHTDDLPLLEFEAPRGLFAPEAHLGLRLLAAGITRDAAPPTRHQTTYDPHDARWLGPGASPEVLRGRWLGVAAIYRAEGQLAEARAAVERAPQQPGANGMPRPPRPPLLSAAIALDAGDLPRCEAQLQAVQSSLASQPDAAIRRDYTLIRARLLARQHRYDEALDALDSLPGDLDGRSGVERLAALVQLRRGDDALAQAERLLAAARPGAEVEALEVEQVYRHLIDLARGGGLDPARAAVLVEKYPVDGLPRFPREKALATLLMMAHRPAEALEHARAALSGGAVDAKLLEIQTRALVELGHLEEAATIEERRQRLAPEPDPIPTPLLDRR